MTEVSLRIDGMHCGACIRRVTNALQSVSGAEVEEVRLGAARVKTPHVERAAGDVVTASMIAALAKAGFPAYIDCPAGS